ncbi:MAG: UbiA family prenyltransferase [Phycisphaeraceae bacterium]
MRWVVFTNVYVALCGAALTAATYSLLGVAPRFDAVAGLVFCCTLIVYNLDRLVEPRPGDTEHERWVERHRPMLWAITAAASIGAIVFSAMLGPRVFVSLALAGAIAIGYCLPVVRLGGRWRRLKELPGIKLVLIAGVWTYATAGLPMLHARVALDAQSVAILAARLLFIAAVALPFDLPDAQRDRQSGIATLPILFGVDKTKHIAVGLALAAALLGGFNPWPMAGAVVLSALVALGLVLGLKAERGVGYFMVALDGVLLVQAAGLWALAMA